MDPNFQTSFIPKKPLAEERVPVVASTSLFSFLATLIFFGALASAAGMYFYEASLKKSISAASVSLAASRNSFEPTLISQLKTLDRRLTDANKLLANHVAVSPIFEVLSETTLKSIQFTKFSFTNPTSVTAPISVRMSGKARDYSSIALESDQLALNKNIHNPIFSNLALDEKTGMVSFDLVFTVSADLVRFTNHLDALVSQQGIPQSTSPETTQDTSGAASGETVPTETPAPEQPAAQ